MKAKTMRVVCLGLLLASAGVQAAKPGKVWEVKSEMVGMPMAMPA